MTRIGSWGPFFWVTLYTITISEQRGPVISSANFYLPSQRALVDKTSSAYDDAGLRKAGWQGHREADSMRNEQNLISNSRAKVRSRMVAIHKHAYLSCVIHICCDIGMPILVIHYAEFDALTSILGTIWINFGSIQGTWPWNQDHWPEAPPRRGLFQCLRKVSCREKDRASFSEICKNALG